jgi:hypothetical protein
MNPSSCILDIWRPGAHRSLSRPCGRRGSRPAARAQVKRTDGDFANAWDKSWGSGRVFYTALGHRPEVWQGPADQQHLAGGITRAIGGR